MTLPRTTELISFTHQPRSARQLSRTGLMLGKGDLGRLLTSGNVGRTQNGQRVSCKAVVLTSFAEGSTEVRNLTPRVSGTN